ncbi:M4 family metallopeptidase [Nocardioides sp. URHA0020]|uniref:M4 family metallopeptidase n=1 Tax=Nocardioides sp. URHA0020 TaxID=1380392 RepID=UPI00055DC8EA|nr:M4 family metallopeptidase [Nocardioides sp. URHA0020]
MRTRTLLGAALAVTVSGTLALGLQAPSYSGPAAHTGKAADHRPVSDAAARTAARSYVADHRATFRASPHDAFQHASTTQGAAGTQYVAYDRTYRGLPVVGGDFVLAVDPSGKVTGRSVTQPQVIDLASTAPTRTAASARRTAKRQVGRVTSASEPELVVFARSTPTLAWQTLVVGTTKNRPTKLTVYTDATTGKVLDSWDQVVDGTGNGYYYPGVTIGTSSSGSTYRMSDASRSGVSCANQAGTIYTGPDDAWGNGSGTNLETGCVDVLYSVDKEVDMLSAWLGRSGVKGNGTSYPARVGLADVNAYFDGTKTNFGHSQDNARQLTAIDIVAHENGHGVFETTPGGSTGDNETGGMNEATGDIFGALTEAYAANPNDPADFTVGEEADLVGDGPIRYMYNPSVVGDPNCYSSSIKNTEVHAAAGPLNHWFYLLSQGSGASPASPTCNGSSVTGVGIQTAGRIFYNGLLLKTTYWTHGKARVATLTAAKSLYGTTDCTTFNRVKAAWDAVSVPAQSGEPTCGTTGGGGGGACTKVTATGTATSRTSTYKPSSTGFSVTTAGTIRGCLTGPSGVDLDLYLQKKSGSSWVDVGSSESATSTESITYSAATGTYRWEVYAYSGSGAFTLGYDTP